MKIPHLSPAVRISFSLTGMLIAWVLLLQMTVGILPDDSEQQQKLRLAHVETLATKASLALQAGNFVAIQTIFNQEIVDHHDTLSIGLRKKDGRLLVKTADHMAIYQPKLLPNEADYLNLELNADNQVWGYLEMTFKPIQPPGFFDWLKKPVVLVSIATIIAMLIFFSIYLKKILHYLDPSAVIPDRIRAAFDAFSEGVLMVDRSGYVVLMNKTVNDWLGDPAPYFGKHITQLPWLKNMQLGPYEKYPWTDAMDIKQPINGVRLDFKQHNGDTVNAVFNCSPVIDGTAVTRGCLISIDNITASERLNQELQQANNALVKSREILDKQNEELKKLATRDPMTNCLNRRSFYEMGAKVIERAQLNQSMLTCIIFDIDFFKKINDTYGHGVGDRVIINVAKTAFSGLRNEDLLCRYGGEEFVILLPNANTETAVVLANRLRQDIETKAGIGVLDNQMNIAVTSSFGVSEWGASTNDLSQLIELADQALYQAKNTGRNKVIAQDAMVAI